MQELGGFEADPENGVLVFSDYSFTQYAIVELTDEEPTEAEPTEAEPTEDGQTAENEAEAADKADSVSGRELTAQLDDILVLAEVPENALNEGAQLHVSYYNKEEAIAAVLSVVNEATEEAAESGDAGEALPGAEAEDTAAAADALTVSSALALDIGFLADGAPVEPTGEAAIRVTVTADAITGMIAPKLFHLTDGSAEEMTDAAFDVEAGTLVFESDTFSPFVIVDLNKPETVETPEAEPETTEVQRFEHSITDPKGLVEVSGMLPEDAVLQVVEIPLTSAVELAMAGTGVDVGEEEVLFAYDVSILSGGVKYDPEEFGESITVRILDVENDNGVDVVHIKADITDEEGALDEDGLAAACTGDFDSEYIEAGTEGSACFFDTESLSPFIGLTNPDTGELDEAAIEAWKEQLRAEGYGEEEIAAMVASLYAEKNTLQKQINAKLIKEMTVQPPRMMLKSVGSLPEPDTSDVITLDTDYTEALIIPADVEVTIDLAGHSISAPADSGKADLIVVYGKLTLTDSVGGTVDGNGTTNMRGVRVTARGSFTLSGGTIQNFNTEGNGGGVHVENNCSFVMSGGTIRNCTAVNYGGGVFVFDAVNAVFTGGTVTGNTANNGGGIALNTNSDGTATPKTISALTVSGNTATNLGGGIYADSALALILSGCTVEGNTGLTGGGLYFLNVGKVTVEADTSIIGNKSTNAGGGIRLNSSAAGNAVYLYGKVNGNTSTGSSGGGIFIAGTNSQLSANPRNTLVIDGGELCNNSALSSGGGAVVTNDSNKSTIIFTMQNGAKVSGNTCTGTTGDRYGGGINLGVYATMNLTGGEISDNYGASRGGGLSCGNYGTLTLTDGFTVTGNETFAELESYGGGIYMGSSSTVSMTGGEVSHNRVEGNAGYGGGFHIAGQLNGSSVVFSGGTICNNYALYTGGGIYNGGTTNLKGNCVVTENECAGRSSYWGGGGIAGSCVVSENAKVTNNRSTSNSGGGIYNYSGSVTLKDNAEVSGNRSSNAGGGVASSNFTISGNAKLTNNTSSSNGGGYYNTNRAGRFTMTGGEITNNTAGSAGGGVYLQSANKNNAISGGIIANNSTSSSGGGIFAGSDYSEQKDYGYLWRRHPQHRQLAPGFVYGRRLQRSDRRADHRRIDPE